MKKIIISIILISILFISGCEFLFAFDEELNEAVETGDPKKCAKLEENEDGTRIDRCYKTMAREKAKPEICDLIDKNRDEREYCLQYAGIAALDPSACIKITDDSNKKDNCYSGVAVGKNDPELCTKLKNDYNLNECVTKVSINKGDTEPCELYSSSSDGATKCITSVAGKLDDVSLCDKVVPEDTNKCVLSVAIINKKATYCAEIYDSNLDIQVRLRDSCYDQVAANKDDPTVCERIQTLEKNEECYTMFAKNRMDASFCTKIEKAGTRDKCIHNVAVTYKNETVCASLEGSLKESCLKSIKLSEYQY